MKTKYNFKNQKSNQLPGSTSSASWSITQRGPSTVFTYLPPGVGDWLPAWMWLFFLIIIFFFWNYLEHFLNWNDVFLNNKFKFVKTIENQKNWKKKLRILTLHRPTRIELDTSLFQFQFNLIHSCVEGGEVRHLLEAEVLFVFWHIFF